MNPPSPAAQLRALMTPRESAAAHSPRAFPDGAAYHVEIPSVEGPDALGAVLEEASRLGVTVHRVSQGSGVCLLRDAELAEMAEIGRSAGVEVVLWCGLRAAWDVSSMARSPSGATSSASVRGEAGLRGALDEAMRAAAAGVDGVLVADFGLLSLLGRAKKQGVLPAGFVLKTSLALPCANAETAAVLVELGATTLNLPTDMSIAEMRGIRSAVGVPLDVYVEGADDFGGSLRYHEVEDIVAAAAPVHLKFGLRNAPGVYPSGGHLAAAVEAGSRERVRRAAIALESLQRSATGNSEAL